MPSDILDSYFGHAGAGTGTRVYTDRTRGRVWTALQEAVALIPPMPPELEARVVGLARSGGTSAERRGFGGRRNPRNADAIGTTEKEGGR